METVWLINKIQKWIKENKWLVFWILLTAFSSVLHYGHNIAHFEHYPEPKWLNPQIIDWFWFVMTPFAIIGCFFDMYGLRRTAFVLFALYALMNMLTLLHYGCEIRVPISFTIHLFIWFEAICAAILLSYVSRRLLLKIRKMQAS